MIEQMLTGLTLGIAFLWVLIPFRSIVLPNRKWVDLLLMGLLVYILFAVRSNYVTGLTTYAGITISIGLRIWGRLYQWKTR